MSFVIRSVVQQAARSILSSQLRATSLSQRKLRDRAAGTNAPPPAP